MCGIAGFSYIKPDKKISKRFFNTEKYLFHRGPENTGFFKNPHLDLIHTRLSIVDIKGGNQPIQNKRYVLVANGEIYNDPEIRKKNRTYKFVTNSDSESILALYERNGIDGLKLLRGMYAFIIYDKKRDEVIIGRDEFGIKPLYYSLMKNGIAFCSETKPIVSLKKSIPNINVWKLFEYMQLQYSSGTETLYEGIQRVAPGQILVIKRGKIIKSFLSSFTQKKKSINDAELIASLDKSLRESVSSHLRSDVPYCIFFSGGIDSMLLLHYVHQLKKENVTAYSISFDEDTSKSLEKITQTYNVDLVKVKFSEDDFWNWIFLAAEKIDEPVADYAILPTLKLASIASKKYKVALTGEGGDELFGGYGRYKKSQRVLFGKKDYLPKGAFNDVLGSKKFQNWEYELKNLNSFFLKNKVTRLQSFQLFDYYNWLPNNLLVKLDRCLMTFSMEGRTPFIDKKLFNKLFYISDKEKIYNGVSKFYIRKFLNSNIQNYNFFKKKKGFTVPIYEWIPKKINFLRELLLKQDFLKEYFSKDELVKICNATRINKKFVKPLWHIIFFTSWYLVNIKGIKKRGNFFDILADCN